MSPDGGLPARATLTIRAAEAADSGSVARLLEQLGYAADAGEMPARLAAVGETSGRVLLAVDDDGTVLGLVGVHSFPVIHAFGPVACITALVVAGETRGRGVGRRLVAAAEQWARAAGCGRLSVTSAEHRKAAHAFYPAAGLPYTGRRYGRTLSPGDARREEPRPPPGRAS